MATKITSGGIGFCSALFLLFLGLRLSGHIGWAWYWVAAPLLAIPALIIALLIIGGALYGIGAIGEEVLRRRRFNRAGAEAARRLRDEP